MSFIDKVISQAKNDVKNIVLPEGIDNRIIEAAKFIKSEGIANITVLLNQHDNESKNRLIDFGINVVTLEESPNFEKYAQSYYEMRKAKGTTLSKARDLLTNPVNYGVMMVKYGEVDGMVAGAITSTGDTLRPALQILKTKETSKIVSSFFIMDVPNCDLGSNGLFAFADCGLVEDPNTQQLSEIAIETAKSFDSLTKNEPIVALLSYSTLGSAKSKLTIKVQDATKLIHKLMPNLKVVGEIQADAAIISAVGKSKAPGNRVAGNANVLVFPDINSGNIAYKLVQRLAKADAFGPITQGLSKPVNDLSRGCSKEDILGVVAITCVQAQNM